MRILALLGDSILDNQSYTKPHPDTATVLSKLLPKWDIRLEAQDGALIRHVPRQLLQLDEPNIIVVSMGGNDALQYTSLIEDYDISALVLLDEMATMAEKFGEDYAEVLELVTAKAPQVVACTIYEAPLYSEWFARLAKVPLTLLNDQIIRIAARMGVPVLDLREICVEPEDYTLDIEPSAQGASKIAEAIATMTKWL